MTTPEQEKQKAFIRRIAKAVVHKHFGQIDDPETLDFLIMLHAEELTRFVRAIEALGGYILEAE